MRKQLTFLVIVASISTAVFADSTVGVGDGANIDDQVAIDGLPAIGKWLIQGDLSNPNLMHVANWLGYKLNGREIVEPINIIFEVTADSTEAAESKLITAITKAGFKNRRGHSSDYVAAIDGHFNQQLTAQANHAYSDAFYMFNNNHGRIFGVAPRNGKYYFTAAFSREKAAVVNKIESRIKGTYSPFHTYISFTEARDHFIRAMVDAHIVSSAHPIALDNTVDSSTQTTGDHDGIAVMLSI
jgi:hypothetical protein